MEDLIFDSNARKVRYIVASMEMDGSLVADPQEDSQLVLIPIGIVNLDEEDDEVIVPEASALFLATLPRYEHGKTISPAEEMAVRYAILGEDFLPDDDAVVYEQHPEDF